MIALEGIKKPGPMPGTFLVVILASGIRAWRWSTPSRKRGILTGLVFAGRFQDHLPKKLDPFVQRFRGNALVVATDAAFAGLTNE